MRRILLILAWLAPTLSWAQASIGSGQWSHTMWDGGPSGQGTYSVELRNAAEGGGREVRITWTYQDTGVAGSLRMYRRTAEQAPPTSTGDSSGTGIFANDVLPNAGASQWIAITADTAHIDVRASMNWFGELQHGAKGFTHSAGAPQPEKKVNIAYRNDREYSVNWKVVDAADPSTVIAGGVLGPGEAIAGAIELPAGVDAVTMMVAVDGVTFDGRNWVEDPTAKTEVTVVSNVPGSTEPTPPVTSVPEPKGLPPAAPSNPTETPPSSPQPPVWKAPTPGTMDTERLDKATYKEGVDKLYVRLGEVGEKVGKVSAKLQEHEDTRKAENDQAKAAAKDVQDKMGTQGTAAKSSAEGSVQSLATPSLGASGSSPSAGSALSIPVGDMTFNLDPATEPTLNTLSGYVKTLITWCVLAFYAWWVWSEFRGFMSTAVSLQQAKGNPVVGGTGGQATSLIAAGLISAALLVIPAAFFALNPFGLSSLDSNPFSTGGGPLSVAGYLLYFWLPMGTILGVLAGMFVVRKGGLVILVGVAAVVRFIVP